MHTLYAMCAGISYNIIISVFENIKLLEAQSRSRLTFSNLVLMHLFFQSPTSSIFHFQMVFSLMHLNQLLSLLFIKNILFLMMNCPATDLFPISISFQKFSNASYILACPTIYNLFHLCVLFKVLIAHSILLKLLYFAFTMIFFFPSTKKSFCPRSS